MKTAVGCLPKCKILADFDKKILTLYKKNYMIKHKNTSTHQLEIKVDVI